MNNIYLYVGSAVLVLWGIGHLMPTKSVVSGFGDISADNKRIITMEWLAEGLTLCFLGILVAFSAFIIGSDQPATHLVARACAVLLFALAVVSSVTGARTAILPMKLCPFIKTAVGVIYIVGTLV